MNRYFSKLSLEWKLPLALSVLVLVVISALSTAAYLEVSRTTRRDAEETLQITAGRLGNDWLQVVAQQLANEARVIAARPAVKALVRSAASVPAEAARQAVRYEGPEPLSIKALELRNRSGQRVVLVGADPGSTGQAALSGLSDTTIVGRFQTVGDAVAYPASVSIMDRGVPIGRLTIWRRLIGTLSLAGVEFMVGSPGGTWTNLSGAVAEPPVDTHQLTGLTRYYRPGSGIRLASAAPVPGTPWTIVLEASEGAMLAPVDRFLRRLALIATILFTVGLLGAWWLSRRLTRPLRELTGAAGAIALADYTGRVRVEREDELGQLAVAFNLMASRVEESQQRLEDRVKARTAELLERNQEMEAFGYSISHDLRAPLRAMHGFSRIILEDYGPAMDEAGRGHAMRVISAAQRMDQLIADLLAYSQMTRADLKLGPVALQAVVREALTQLEAELQDRGATVQIQEPLPAVLGHQPTLSQVVANLVGNGIKFVAPGQSPRVQVRAERQDHAVRLWVEDNGIGIPPEHLNRVFGVFDRLHSTEQYPGTGIGLAIVKKGIERMGGRVGVHSTVGTGSRFWIELPLAEQAA